LLTNVGRPRVRRVLDVQIPRRMLLLAGLQASERGPETLEERDPRILRTVVGPALGDRPARRDARQRRSGDQADDLADLARVAATAVARLVRRLPREKLVEAELDQVGAEVLGPLRQPQRAVRFMNRNGDAHQSHGASVGTGAAPP